MPYFGLKVGRINWGEVGVTPSQLTDYGLPIMDYNSRMWWDGKTRRTNDRNRKRGIGKGDEKVKIGQINSYVYA